MEGFLVSGKYVALQICDDKDVETMLESFQQQNQMSVLELYIEKDVTGGSMFHSANSLTSCGNNLSNNEAQPPTNVSNLHGDEDDDDDYLVSNSYVEESLDEDDSVDGISDTDDEVTDIIQPVRIVHPTEGVQGIENPFWSDALYYNNIDWSHLDEEDICDLEMSSSFNVGQELYVGMDFDTKDAVHQTFKVVESKSNKINSEFAYKVSYKKAWLAKQKAIALEYGDWEESYAKLSLWLTHMQNHSRGSYFQILHDDFIVGNTEAFKFCKPIIQVDGTHLYGKYQGTLLVATLQDENGGVLPLAFAVVEGETHASIKSVVANEVLGWQPPHGYHVYCVRHIANNFNRKFNNAKQKEMLKKLKKFRQLSHTIATWIDRISKEKWIMAYDREGRRYEHMTTNLSECINKVLKDCRNILITALAKSTYSRCRKYFVDHGRQAQRQLNEGQVYCSKLVKELRKNQEQACSHIVRVYDIHPTRKYFVLHYPCSHIIAACGYVSMNYYQYIDVVYTNEHILKAYSAQWWPLGNEAAISLSNDAWTLIPDPTTIRTKGRP
ncbi:hypothetical protein HKD37_05G012804 [Glycine soja]